MTPTKINQDHLHNIKRHVTPMKKEVLIMFPKQKTAHGHMSLAQNPTRLSKN